MESDFATRSTSFLDVNIQIVGGTLNTDLYTKPTAANQYLQPNSTHPEHISRNIPYSLAFRNRRICSRQEDFDLRLGELRRMLLDRKYLPKVIDAAFSRVRKLSREQTLKKVQREDQHKTAFVTTYDPRLPNIGSVLQTHYKTLNLDPKMKEIFQDGMVCGYKRYKNIRDFLFRAKLYDPSQDNQSTRPQRQATKGWRKCSSCVTCKHSENRTRFTSKATGEVHFISQNITCKVRGIIYLIECRKCGVQYVGKSIQNLMKR